MRARVVLNEPVGLLDYGIPDAVAHAVVPGVAVRVPLGKRHTSAYVLELVDTPLTGDIAIKDLEGIDAERPTLPPKLLELVVFAANYYDVSPGDVLDAALPSVARAGSARFKITEKGLAELRQPEITESVPVDLFGHAPAAPARPKDDGTALLEVAARFPKGFTVQALERELGWPRRLAISRAKKHIKNGTLGYAAKKKGGPRELIGYKRLDAPAEVLASLAPKVRVLFDAMPVGEPVSAAWLGKLDTRAYERVKKLEKAGLVWRERLEQRLTPYGEADGSEEVEHAGASAVAPASTPEQATAIADIEEAIASKAFTTFLLNGVTGSGKTEVYLRIIESVLARGQTALVLVPEIALTPQLGARFRARFGGLVATFHSGLTVAERRDEWERVVRGEARIGLGARSALFLPLTDVGVIIVDEEHETSFKQDETPRYNARDLAVFRGRQEGAVVVLGSATPSLESRGNVVQGRYRELTMRERVMSRPLPEVKKLDLAKGERVGQGIFTAALAAAIERGLAANEQTILFLNRRGFASVVYCADCGHTYKCDDCDVSLTLHRRRGQLACHYCGHEEESPDDCAACKGHNLQQHGLGTERVEAELRMLLGDIPVARLDRDTVRRRSDLTRELTRFARGEAKVLIGTQMVAKGHDFPGVTLVGVVSADAGLSFPDFRAAERTFQLLTQVAGRAGRGEKPGIVMVQTYDTEHYAIQAAAKHDYESFARQELLLREELGYPPYTHLVLSRYECENERLAMDAAKLDATRMREVALARHEGAVQVLGPAIAPLARLQGRHRVQVLLKGRDRAGLRDVMRAMRHAHPQEVRQVVDVDPFSML